MNTTNAENTPELHNEPVRITRRTFVKRTGSTAIVTALALHAFRSEAFAASSAGSYLVKKEGSSKTLGGISAVF